MKTKQYIREEIIAITQIVEMQKSYISYMIEQANNNANTFNELLLLQNKVFDLKENLSMLIQKFQIKK